MVVLRLLNMTVLRVQWIADLFRKIVVARLMGDAALSDVTLERTIRIDHESCTVADRIRGGRPGEKMGRLFRCRRITGLHMASSRYFQPDELRKLDVGWCEAVEWKGAEAASERWISLAKATAPPVNER